MERVIQADQEFVFNWWTDLSEDDPKLVKPLKSRKIISRAPDKIVLQDEERMYFRRMSFDVQVTLDRPKEWVALYDGTSARAKSEYILSSNEPGITHLQYHSRIEPKDQLTRLFSPIVKPFVKRIFSGEMDVFVRELESEFRKNIDSETETRRKSSTAR